LKIIDSTDDDEEEASEKVSRKVSNGAKKNGSSGRKTRKANKIESDDDDDEYQPSPEKNGNGGGTAESESDSAGSAVDEDDISTPDEDGEESPPAKSKVTFLLSIAITLYCNTIIRHNKRYVKIFKHFFGRKMVHLKLRTSRQRLQSQRWLQDCKASRILEVPA